VEKVNYLISTFNIPRENIFDSRGTTFLQELMQVTAGRGVDVVLNSLSGELLHASWKCVAEFGIMLELGKRDIQGHGSLEMRRFDENRMYAGIDYQHISNKQPWKVTE